jgi:hypothetical protein
MDQFYTTKNDIKLAIGKVVPPPVKEVLNTQAPFYWMLIIYIVLRL